MCKQMEIVIEIIKAIPVFIASGVALYGINSWRREAKWKVKYSLAEEVLTLAYEIRDAIRAMRSPVSYQGEGSTRRKADDEYFDDTQLMNRAYIPRERFETYRDSFNKFQAAKYRFMAIYGSEYEELFIRLNHIVNEIFASAHLLGTVYWKQQGKSHWDIDSPAFKSHLKSLEYHEAKFWEISDNDEISQRVKEIVSDFEKICAATVRENRE